LTTNPNTDSNKQLAVDPDVAAPRRPTHGRRTLRERWDILLVISVGGALGSVARWAVGTALPHLPGRLAWSTMVENLSGGLLLGVLMVLVTDVWPPNRYLRPFLGIGVLGGYTTFSTYMLDTRSLIAAGEIAPSALYLFGTLVVGLLAVWLGILIARTVVQLRQRKRGQARAARSRATPAASSDGRPTSRRKR
jgi:fluoride exporter